MFAGEPENLDEILENQELLLCGGVPLRPVDESVDALLVLPPRGGVGLAGVDGCAALGFEVGAAVAGEDEGEWDTAFPFALFGVVRSTG